MGVKIAMFDFLNISVGVSFFTVAISVISSIIMYFLTKDNLFSLNIIINSILKISIKKDDAKDLKHLIVSEKLYLAEDNIDACFKILVERIQKIYPKIKVRVSVKLIEGLGDNTTCKSLVYLWHSYPESNYDDGIKYVIENNTDFNSIIQNKREYFFVSDLKEFSAISQYKNSSKNFLYNYNSSIVCPICKKEKGQIYDIVGFLCVDSPQKLNNVENNERIIKLIEVTASILYEYIIKNKDNSNFLTVRQE